QQKQMVLYRKKCSHVSQHKALIVQPQFLAPDKPLFRVKGVSDTVYTIWQYVETRSSPEQPLSRLVRNRNSRHVPRLKCSVQIVENPYSHAARARTTAMKQAGDSMFPRVLGGRDIAERIQVQMQDIESLILE